MRTRSFQRLWVLLLKSFVFKCPALVTLFAGLAAAQPVILALQNNYSYTYPGLPNYAISQGALFDIFGAGLAADATLLQSPPLSTSLNTVTVNVTVGGVTVNPPLYYLSPNQIAAIMPSATPLGKGQITVTYNGTTSAAFAVTIAPSAFGILTWNNAGMGAAAAFDHNGNMLTFSNAANPGDEVLFWGSGLGAAPGNDGDWQTQQNLTGNPIDVKIGGVPAQVNYQGRSIYPGVDQIKAVVPPGVQGCRTSVAVRSGDIVSNFATIPVAASGRACSDVTTGLTSQITSAIGQQATVRTGNVVLGTNISFDSSGASSTSYTASSAFQNYSGIQFLASPTAAASMGSCVVYTALGPGLRIPPGFSPSYLNAGSSVNVTEATGTVPLSYDHGVYDSPVFPLVIPNGGGSFAINNGGGGTDVGPFSVSLTIPPSLVWTNRSSATTVNRPQGVTVTWSGGDPASYVQISGGSSTAAGPRAFFGCTAPVSAGSFTVPAEVLLSLPAGQGFLAVANFVNPQQFSAANLDAGYATGYVSYISAVAYQ
jgi:uncharacterized protein (TIGR03437 family)